MPNYTAQVISPFVQKYKEHLIKINFETLSEAVEHTLMDGTETTVEAELRNLRDMINTLMESCGLTGGSPQIYLVSNIEERDALDSIVTNGEQCWVLDASDDEEVESGSALYIYLTSTGWSRLNTNSAIDFRLIWDQIEGRPISDVTDIDVAVELMHTHANKDVLDKLIIENGELVLSNTEIKREVAYTTIKYDDPTFKTVADAMNLVDGAIITVIGEVEDEPI